MNITAKNICDYIYTKMGSANPFNTVLQFADGMYKFAKGWGHIPRSYSYIDFMLDFLNFFTNEAVTPKMQKIVNFHLHNADLTKCKAAPSEYITAITNGAHTFAVDYKTACEKVAGTRQMLHHSRPMFNIEENAIVCEYIEFINKYRPEYPTLYFYGDLFNLGFIQGIRAERARRKGSAISKETRTRAALYAGIKHRKRYRTA